MLEDPSLPKNSPVDLGMLDFSDDASLENIVSEELILSISDKIHYEELQEINNDDEFFQYVLKVAAEVMVESGSQDDFLLDLACDGKLSEANYERIEKNNLSPFLHPSDRVGTRALTPPPWLISRATFMAMNKNNQRAVIIAAANAASANGLPTSGTLLVHACQDNPPERSIRSGTTIDNIRSSPEFINEKNKFIRSGQGRAEIWGFAFESNLDLKLGIQGLTYFATNSNNRNVYMEDIYDFEFKRGYGNSIQNYFITFINNVGAVAFQYGTLNDYKINILFKY